MKIEEIKTLIAGFGIKKQFKPYEEPETGDILLHTRKKAAINDHGDLSGSEIDLWDTKLGVFRVWTAQTKKARRFATEHNLTMDELTRECHLYVPARLADNILPQFGAKVKRTMSPKQIEASRKGRANSPLFARSSKSAHPQSE